MVLVVPGAKLIMKYDSVNNSGKFETYISGAIRDVGEGKGFYDCIPYHGINRVAIHYENGAKKYGIDNWVKGMPQRRFLNSAIRHLFRYLAGDRSEDHLSAAIWNCLAMIDQEERIERGLLDKKFMNLPNTTLLTNELKENTNKEVLNGRSVKSRKKAFSRNI